MSNYAQKTIDRLNDLIPGNDQDLIRLYSLLVHVKGTAASLEDVHEAWAMWRAATRPDHPDLIPFEQLDPSVQEYDREYRDAIRRVAAEVSA